MQCGFHERRRDLTESDHYSDDNDADDDDYDDVDDDFNVHSSAVQMQNQVQVTRVAHLVCTVALGRQHLHISAVPLHWVGSICIAVRFSGTMKEAACTRDLRESDPGES